MITRRDILAYSSAMAASIPLQKVARMASANIQPSQLVVFEKVLQNLSPEQLADALVKMDADGIEVAIRPGGRIEPADAEKKIPQLVKALDQRGKKILIATTNITSVVPESTRLLEILADNQIPQYRMGYYRWNKKDSRQTQCNAFGEQLTELAVLNRKLGITGLYQNHAGDRYFGSLIWAMLVMLDDIPADQINLALDLRHLRAEAGLSWPTLVRNAANRIGCLYIKDARWKGPKTNQLENVPLGNGFVDRGMFEAVRKQCPSVPISLHVEYHGGKPLEGAALQQAIESYRRDIKRLRQWMAQT